MSEVPPRPDVDFEALVSEFVERRRRGESPSLEDYVARYPDLETRIRDTFPSLIWMEDLGRVLKQPRSPQLPWKELGPYRILRQIGRGGMGVVYEAAQVAARRRVALKVLPGLSSRDPRALERFHNEAVAASALEHPNIIPVYDVGEAEGVPYYAMRLIDGEGLDRVLEALREVAGQDRDLVARSAENSGSESRALALARRLRREGTRPGSSPGGDEAAPTGAAGGRSHRDSSSWREAGYYKRIASIGETVALALAAAHESRIVHRDIKPSNILLDLEGHVWVGDFGLAKMQGQADLTVTGELVGTLAYMAPERFDDSADARSDVYSLGATLYELVALRPAFQARNRTRLMRRIVNSEAPRLKELCPDLPSALRWIIDRTLEKEPARRYPSAGALAADLRRFIDDMPVQARQSSRTERLLLWAKRNPSVAWLGAVVIILLVSVAVVSSLAAWRLADVARDLRREKETTQQLLVRSRQSERSSLFEKVQALELSARPGRRSDALEALRRGFSLAPGDVAEVAIAIAALSRVEVRELRRDAAPPLAGHSRFPMSPDLNLLAYRLADGSIQIDDRSGSGRSRVLEGVTRLPVQFSRDGTLLVLSDADGFEIVDVDRGERRMLVVRKRDESGLGFRDLSPDGRWIAAVAAGNTELRIYELGAPGPSLTIALEEPASEVSFAPDSGAIAWLHGPIGVSRQIRVARLEDGGERLRTVPAPSGVISVVWRDPHSLVAACTERGFVLIEWEASAASEVRTRRLAPADHAREFALSPDGEFLYGIVRGRTIVRDLATGEVVANLNGTLRGVHGRERRISMLEPVTAQIVQYEVSPSPSSRAIRVPDDLGSAGALAFTPGNDWLLVQVERGLAVVAVPSLRIERVLAFPLLHLSGATVWLPADAASVRPWPLSASGGKVRLGPPGEALAARTYQVESARVNRAIRWLEERFPGVSQQVSRRRAPGARAVLSEDATKLAVESPAGVELWVLGAGAGAENTTASPQAGEPYRSMEVPDCRLVGLSRTGGWLIVVHATRLALHSTRQDPASRASRSFEIPGVVVHGVSATFAFSPEDRYLAIVVDQTRIEIHDVENRRVTARLGLPAVDQGIPYSLSLADGGARLAATTTGGLVHLWDLRELGRQLGTLGVVWDGPAGSPRTPPGASSFELVEPPPAQAPGEAGRSGE